MQVAGDTEALLARHRRLTGPRNDCPDRLPGVSAVVRSSHTDRQTSLIALTNGACPPDWDVQSLSVEDLLLVYLAEPEAGLLPGPAGLAAPKGATR